MPHFTLIWASLVALPRCCFVTVTSTGRAATTAYDFGSLVKDLRATGEVVEVTDRLRDDDMSSDLGEHR